MHVPANSQTVKLQQLRQILDPSPIPTWVNIDGKIAYVNRAGCELLGLKSWDELSDRSPFDIIEPEFHPLVQSRVEALRDRKVYVTDPASERWKRVDGTTVEVEVLAWTIPIDSDYAVQVSFRDLTEVRAAERLRREHEEDFRLLADAIPQLCWMANADGWLFWYNRRWYEYTGTTPEQMQGWGWKSVHDRSVLPHVMEKWTASIATGQPFEMVFPLRGADGIFRPFLTRILPFRDEQGNITRWFGTNTDITSEKESELSLRDSLNRFTALVNSVPEIIWTCNENGECDYLSQRWFDFTGSSLQQSLRYGWLDFIHPEDRGRTFIEWQNAVRTHKEFSTEFRIRRSDGEYHWFLTRAVPYESAEGGTRWFGSNTDITDRKLAEEALIRTEKLASAGRMAATVAHEINNPLEAIVNALYLVKTTKNLPESAQSLLALADDELRRVAHITRQALGFYREATSPKEVAVESLIDSALEIVAAKLAKKHIRVRKEYLKESRVLVVPGEVRQVFTNLIVNAIDAIKSEGELRLRASKILDSKGQPLIRVTISDNGDGIPPAAKPHIFEPFFTTKESIGTGLGLWVSRQIVEKHGGVIRVRSIFGGPKHGTVFTVLLPAAQ